MPDRNVIRVHSLLILAACLVVSACGGGGSGGSSQPTPNSLPSISGLFPSSATLGAAAQTLDINGTNFLSDSTVTYNNVAHTATFVSSTQLTISLSASDQATAGSYAVVVTNPAPGGGASNSSNFAVNNPVPAISSLSPTDVTVASGAFTLTVTGSGFVPTSAVSFNGTVETTTFVSSTQVTAAIPASAIAAIGSASVSVANPTPGGGTAQAPSPFQVDGGFLSVAIIDLPTGSPASVTVTGPNGYSTNLTTSQTLQVAPGAYTVVGNSVGVAQSNYYPVVATQAGTVSNSATTTVTVDYSTIIPTNTKVLDSAGMSSLTVSSDGSTITLSTLSAVAQSLAAGNVLASATTTAAPNGLLVKILSVRTSGGTITASVEQATLEDAIQQATFQFTATLGPGNTQANTRALMRNRGLLGRALGLPHRMDSSGGACAGNTNTIPVPFSVQLAAGGLAATALSGEGDFCPSFSLTYQISSFQLVSANATVTLGAHLSMTVGDNGGLNVTHDLPSIQTSAIPATIGGVPVVVQLSLTPFVGVTANSPGSVSADTGVAVDSALTLGVSYANGAWSPIGTASLSTASPSATSVDGPLTLKAFVGAKAGVTLDGFLTPYFSSDGYLQLDSNPTGSPCWNLNAGLEANVGLDVTFLGGNLANYSSPTLNLYTYPGGWQATTTCSAPTLSSITPNMAQIMSPQLTLALGGSNFVPDSIASFNGQALATTFVDPNDLTAVVPASDLAVVGTFPVTVNNPDNPGGTSTPATFTVADVTVAVSPTSASVPVCSTQQFTATVQGTSNTAVTWSVNGINGGNSTVGTITSQGLYTAPTTIPSPATVTVTATSQAETSISASASETITTLSYSFITIDYPGGVGTVARGINNAGQIVGVGNTERVPVHAFLYADGSFSSIDYPGTSDYPGSVGTFATGINDSGEIVGMCAVCQGGTAGFLYAGGSFSFFIFYLNSTSVSGINNSGQIVGGGGAASNWVGFLYSGGSFISIEYPGAPETFPMGINDSGEIVGTYNSPGVQPGSFLYADGSFSSIALPVGFEANGINNSGQIVGNDSSLDYGVVYAGGSLSPIGSPFGGWGVPYGINDSGQIVGVYYDSSGHERGYVATPASTTCSSH